MAPHLQRLQLQPQQTRSRLRHTEAVPELTRLYEKQSSLPAKEADKDHRERLLDAMAILLVRLHLGGCFWGDC